MSRYETVFGMNSDRKLIAGALIEEEMARRNMTREQLADMTGSSVPTIARARTGEMSLVTRIAIEKAFDWHPGFLQAVLDGDLLGIEAYPITEHFTEHIRSEAIRRLRMVQMVIPIREDNGGRAAGNGNGR